MGPLFTFDQNAWANITFGGYSFAQGMFYGCSGASFTMNDVYNLPQGITTVGNYFADSMFSGCSGASFTMSNVFNLPQSITIVDNYFAAYLFYDCSGDSFTMNDDFSLPQGITSVGSYFAESMFREAGGSSFQVNVVFRFPTLTQEQLDLSGVLSSTFYNMAANTPMQYRSARSIINNTLVPSTARSTFSKNIDIYASPFNDWSFVPINYGGNGKFDPGETVGLPGSGDLDGDGLVTIAEALIAAQVVISGIGDLTPAQIDALDIDRDGALTMADIVFIMRLAMGL